MNALSPTCRAGWLLTLALVTTASASRSSAGPSRPLAPPADTPRGVARPSQDVVLGSPVAGLVRTVACHEGQTVAKDQELWALDCSVQETTVSLARTEADDKSGEAIAAARLDLAAIEWAAQKRLMAQDSATQRDVQRAEAEHKEAEGQLAAAKAKTASAAARLKLERIKLDQHTGTAPFPGVISKIEIEPGKVVNPESPAVRLVRLDPLRVDIPIPMDWMERMKPGTAVRLNTDLEGHPGLSATVAAIDPMGDAATHTVRCILEIPNPTGLPSGFIAWVDETAAGH